MRSECCRSRQHVLPNHTTTKDMLQTFFALEKRTITKEKQDMREGPGNITKTKKNNKQAKKKHKKNINNKVCFCETFSAADEGIKLERVLFPSRKVFLQVLKKSENFVFKCLSFRFLLLNKVFPCFAVGRWQFVESIEFELVFAD